MFKICARTVLELGSELISSDVIAFYELIKNALDAGSPSGAEIRFEVAVRRNDYLKLRQRATAGQANLPDLKRSTADSLNPSAPEHSRECIRNGIDAVQDVGSFVEALDALYDSENRIVVSDKGTGMSRKDLIDNYLVIGTPSRRRAIDAALAANAPASQRAPFLGEKGIGRLSAMRLGDRLTVETAEAGDEYFNMVEICWSAFNDLDAMLDEIDVTPELGTSKPNSNWSGTRLTISGLTADWTHDRVKDLGARDFARLTDPFADVKRRPRIAIFWNGTRIPIAHMDRKLLSHAHASVKGRFRYKDSEPILQCTYEARDLGFDHPVEIERREFPVADLEGSIVGTSGAVPVSALYDLGQFEFQVYWFNRQRLGRIDSIGDRKVVRDLQRRWSGILLFRDGFRVLPYGDDNDDWLALDRPALASTGYLLNKAQFVGHVTISRLGNPLLIDQTSREGLRVCPEQQAFIGLLQLAIQTELRAFMREVDDRNKNQPLDMNEAKADVSELERSVNSALRKIRGMVPSSSEIVDQLQHAFYEIKELFDQARSRIDEVESENRQMVQMAGVGLLVEVVAHELARSTENALAALEALRGKDVPDQISGLLDSLRSEMTSVSKRLRVLDPLSVSGRQRKEIFNLGSLIKDVLGSHARQFKRHKVEVKVNLPDHPVRIRAVKGMIVQILENLLSNSIYWLQLRRHREAEFKPCIAVSLQDDPMIFTYEDNGRGIAKENRERAFRAFFSLKEKTKRRGLGLYIARDCAKYHGGSLILDSFINQDTGRLHRFVLQLPSEVVV